MPGPYICNNDGTLTYSGNKVFPEIEDVLSQKFPTEEVEKRPRSLSNDPMWKHVVKINHRINFSSQEFFDSIGALFIPLPLTTRMVSSPGAIYGREEIHYTTDTMPVTVKWFDLEKPAFLSESSQIYLELALTTPDVEHVYSLYNSFRKEKADPTHLSEFHHVEYESKINQEKNMEILSSYLSTLISSLLRKNEEDLSYFLKTSELSKLEEIALSLEKEGIKNVQFSEALAALYRETKNEKYQHFTLEHFGPWEETKITEIFDSLVAVTEFPLHEVPFYHAILKGSNPPKAKNADIIWPGYREIVGSGERISSLEELEEKARLFQLPKEDYAPYLHLRRMNNYKTTSGFGLGWERFVQGVLKTPFIWSAAPFPRGHTTLQI